MTLITIPHNRTISINNYLSGTYDDAIKNHLLYFVKQALFAARFNKASWFQLHTKVIYKLLQDLITITGLV